MTDEVGQDSRWSLSAWIAAGLRSDIVRNAFGTLFTRGGVLAIGFATSIVVARALGPEARGLYGVIAVVAGIGVQFGNLGLHSSNTYYVARDRRLLPQLIGNSLFVSFLAGGAIAGLVIAIGLAWPQAIPVDTGLLVLGAIAIPIGLGYLLLQNLLIGTERFRVYNAIDIGVRLIGFTVVAVAVLAGLASAESLYAAGVVALAVGVTVCAIALVRAAEGGWSMSTAVIRSNLGYGLRAYLASLFAYLVLRSDVLLVNLLRPGVDVGLYSVSASMADLLYVLPSVVAATVFPRLASQDSVIAKLELTIATCRWIALVMFSLAVLAWVFGPVAIGLLYGSAYAGAAGAFAVLALAMVFYGINGIVSVFLASLGFPRFAIWIWLVALGVNGLLNLALIPSIGIVGAAWASVVAYGLVLIGQVVYVRQFMQGHAS